MTTTQTGYTAVITFADDQPDFIVVTGPDGTDAAQGLNHSGGHLGAVDTLAGLGYKPAPDARLTLNDDDVLTLAVQPA